jgi:indole-3-glycerol phosphate synthase
MGEKTAPDVLAAIVGATRRIVELRQDALPAAVLERHADARAHRAGAFRVAVAEGPPPRIIAECKRRSPSRGILRAAYDPVAIASAYERNGAAAVSVLTEPTFFDGAPEHLQAVREAVCVPVLRKDFVIDRYQLLEARAWGADAVLLIVAALSQAELVALVAEAGHLGLDVLVEAHDAEDLRRALDAGATIVGVNNRNLKTLDVSLRTSETLAALVPRGIVAVAESGLKNEADLARLSGAGFRAFLVGERFMTAPDPGAALREFRSCQHA